MEWLPKRTLGAVLERAATQFGDREALVFEDQCWTYTELNAQTDRLAKGLMALGVEPEERVAVWMTNRPEWLLLMFAIARVGGCIVPLNTRYRTDDVAYTVTQSRSATLITLASSGPIDYQQMLLDSMPAITRNPDHTLKVENYPDLRRLVVLGDKRIEHACGWEQLLALGDDIDDGELRARADAVDPDKMMMIAYTSGTTGHPKGVMHSHIPIRNSMERAQIFGLTANDVHMNYLPLFHIYAYSEISMMCVLTGACPDSYWTCFDADRVLETRGTRESHHPARFSRAHWLDLLNAQAAKPRAVNIRRRHPALGRREHHPHRRAGPGRVLSHRIRIWHE